MKGKPDISRLFADGRLIDRALRAGVRAALEQHKKMGLPVVDYQDGKIVMVPPDKIDETIGGRRARNRSSRNR